MRIGSRLGTGVAVICATVLTGTTTPARGGELSRDGLRALPQSGDVVVFVSDRDGNREIYSLDLATGVERNLTGHPGRDQAPAVSPDGRSVAWVSDRSGRLGVWLMAIDGSEARLVREVDRLDFGLAWAPDGGRLAVTLRDDGDVHDLGILDLADGEITRVTATTDLEEVTPEWDVSGEGLYYVRGQGAATAVVHLDLASGSERVIAAELPGVAFPRLSPDGTQLLLRGRIEGFDVLRLDVQTGEFEALTTAASNDWGAAWLGGGQAMVFASDRDGDMELFRLDLASGDVRQLTHNSARDFTPATQ